MQLRHAIVPSILVLASAMGCTDGKDGTSGSSEPTSSGLPSTGATPEECEDGEGGGAGGEPVEPTADFLSPTRQLRRIALAFRGTPPAVSEYEALQAASDPAAHLDAAAADMLDDPAFYRLMVEFGSEWIGLPPIPAVADEPEYIGLQQNPLAPCPEGSLHEGALAMYNPYAEDQPCNGLNADGTDASVESIEPWWAPGTTVLVAGKAADPSAEGTFDGEPVDCGEISSGGYKMESRFDCGCGPNLIWCHASELTDWKSYLHYNPQGSRRLLMDEPARLVGHVAWHDRPLTDLVLGDISVGPVELQAAYVRAGRRNGHVELDQDDSWWQPSKLEGAVDPEHDASDPWAWREFAISERNPDLLAERDYHFDPRTEPRGTMRGIPAAGVLTMIGSLGGFTRERVRGARFLEIFACENFVPPPSDQEFNAYERDPATEGPCQHCHSRIDPAGIHFKRWDRSGAYGKLLMPGVGTSLFPDAWTEGTYPYGGDPFDRWKRLWIPDTRMTPVDAETAAANPESRFIDFLPSDQTMLGETSDGTVGPLGFGKMLVASGAFDRCAVRKLFAEFVGRPLDPTKEAGYLDVLVETFVAEDRKVRPFLRELARSDAFRRGL